MESKPIHIFALISRHQRPELVNPSKRPLNNEPLLVNCFRTQLNFRKQVPKVDQCERNQVESEPIHILTLKPNQQRPEFINPGKGPFNDEAFLVRLTIELPLPSTFDCFPVAFVLWNVGTHASIPQHLPCFSCVKTAIRVEEGRPILQTIALQTPLNN
jgi:hypothetical protein